MAHINHTFEMPGEPAAAQGLFLSQIGPELAKDGSFELVHERPGELLFNDALDEGAAFEDDVVARRGARSLGDEEELSDLPPAATGLIGTGSGSRQAGFPEPLPGENLLARHLHVEFVSSSQRTEVRIHGHARRRLRDALQRLGTPQHWPETSSLPHD